MRPDPNFLAQGHEFWATVKLISQKLGYSLKGEIVIPDPADIRSVFRDLGLDGTRMFNSGRLTDYGTLVLDYFRHRADSLNRDFRPNLMDTAAAKQLFEEVTGAYKARCGIPMNKQTGDKAAPAYFTGIINTLIEKNLNGHPCVYDPRQITAFTHNNFPARSLSRRVDGSFPDEINPIAIWEIKEYYYTTTFGSRIADGVYETMLDGYELRDARQIINRQVFHYLMIDAYKTWWDMGKPYLCRIVDMLHMGLITECLAGREVVEGIPRVVQEWINAYDPKDHRQRPGQLTFSV